MSLPFTPTTSRAVARRAALLRANLGILGQKLDLLQALRTNWNDERTARQKFAETCAVVGASVGQHFRHSNDHLERAANSLAGLRTGCSGDRAIDEIHYDIRVRGGNDETDMDAAEERIRSVRGILQQEMDDLLMTTTTPVSSSSSTATITTEDTKDKDTNENSNNTRNPDDTTVLACFLLSGDPSEAGFFLPSTIDRELGFVAHHAIHHLAMVKIIAVSTLKLLPPEGLPEGFGRAPSTIVFDKNNDNNKTQ